MWALVVALLPPDPVWMVVAMSLLPPQFTLLSHSNLASSSSVTAVNPTTSLAHPSIQYHFRDDPPISLPHPQNKHVLIMDYDPRAPQSIRVQSLSSQLAVTSVKITDAPGAGPYGENDEPRNNKMYVIETVAHQIPDERSVIFLDDPLTATHVHQVSHR